MHVRFSLFCCKIHTLEDGMLKELIGLFPFHYINNSLSYNGWQMYDIIVDIPVWIELQIHSPEYDLNILIEIVYCVKLVCALDQINLQIIYRHSSVIFCHSREVNRTVSLWEKSITGYHPIVHFIDSVEVNVIALTKYCNAVMCWAHK